MQWGAIGFLTGDFSMVVLLLSLASNLIFLGFCGVFCSVVGGGVWVGVGFVVGLGFFFIGPLWGILEICREKYNLVVFLSSISRASRSCSIPS